MQDNIFPRLEEIPEVFKPVPVEGRILINGKILENSFKKAPVYAACMLKKADGTLELPVIGTTPEIDVPQMLEAVNAASSAWKCGTGEWPAAKMGERVAAVMAFRNAIAKKREEICNLLMWEIGKTLPDCQAEFDRTLVYIDDTLEAARQLDRDNSRMQFSNGIIAQIRRSPLGTTLCMGPYNYPFNETMTTLIPALVMGNTIIAKMSRFGQLFWDYLLEAFQSCFPAGVVNIINGEGKTIIGEAMKTGKIDALAFIGSSKVANLIRMQHPMPNRLRCILGLDAKNPAIILPDADLPNAVQECLRGSLSFNGQRCTAIKIIFVHKSLAPNFISEFSQAVDKLRCGLPWEKGVQITPMVEPGKAEYLTKIVAEAIEHGAYLANPDKGGKVVGNLYYPAVLGNVSLKSRIANEEQFGPVVPIVVYENIEEFENYVINSMFGMQASIFGKNPKLVGEIIDKLANQICRINLNVQCQRGPDIYPFTGRKNSAEGTLSVTDALRAFSIRSMVAAKYDNLGKSTVKGILDNDSSKFLSTDILF